MSPKLPVGTEKRPALRAAERGGGDEVVDELGDDARPVDGVDAGSRARSRKARSLNMPFTSAWQSSKVPSMATAWTLASAAWSSCAAARRRCGPREQNEDVDAARAAEGLDRRAAGVAGGGAHDGDALAARCQHAVHQPASSCIATSLKASVGPWNSSSTKWLRSIWASGVTAGCRKAA